jgi:hypothetical protein
MHFCCTDKAHDMGAFKDMTTQDTPPFDVTRTLVAQVKEYATFSPRSQQTMIGASEIGTPCSRRLAYKLLNVEAVNTDTDSWPAIVGTSVHYYLERAFKKHPDYLTEVKVVSRAVDKGHRRLGSPTQQNRDRSQGCWRHGNENLQGQRHERAVSGATQRLRPWSAPCRV